MNSPTEHPAVLSQGSAAAAIRDGEFKLIEPADGSPDQLYNVVTDPTEDQDLVSTNPERADAKLRSSFGSCAASRQAGAQAQAQLASNRRPFRILESHACHPKRSARRLALKCESCARSSCCSAGQHTSSPPYTATNHRLRRAYTASATTTTDIASSLPTEHRIIPTSSALRL